MCGIEYVALGMALAGGATTYAAQRQGAETTQAVGEYNAKLGEIQAKSAEDAGQVAQDNLRKQVNALYHQQRAVMGASGVEGGTLDRVSMQTVTEGEQQIADARLNAQREAWGLRTGALRDRWQSGASADAQRMAANATLLTTAGDMYTKWKGWNMKKVG